MIRPPAVAGRFYSGNAPTLSREINGFRDPDAQAATAIGCVVPHAGYMYSGHVAGAVYSALKMPSRCILLGPRHYPQGQSLAILMEGSFSTPLGNARIDAELAQQLARACPALREDAVAHEREHSLEVQLPFFQEIVGQFSFVPVVLGTDRYGVLEDLGKAVAKVIVAQKEPVLIVASSDMNHYESDAITRAKDEKAIAQILALNPRRLYDTVRNESISMCGYAATTAMLIAARELGATQAKLIRYATSGDVSGDRHQVVGYAGIIIQ
jgi:MEMO1 family protein